MRPAILFLDTNILLDYPDLKDYGRSLRPLTLVVIPEVMAELRGLSRAPARGEAGAALRALAVLEPLARPFHRSPDRPSASGFAIRVLPGEPSGAGAADRQLAFRASAEQARRTGAIVAVVSRDRGVAEHARAAGVKSILLFGCATPSEVERRVGEHDGWLDIDL